MAVALGAAACGDDSAGDMGDAGEPGGCETPCKAAWVYVSPPGDVGWSFSHDQGRREVEQAFGSDVETTFEESVPPSDLRPVLDRLVSEGNEIIFTTSFGYMDATFEAAEQNPDVYFEHASGFRMRENMANYFGRMYQARYLTGVVAGLMTETNEIGITAAHPVAEVIRHINALALGAQSVNPDVEFHVRWVHEWFDPQTVEALSQDLVDAEGVDILIQDTDSNATGFVARDNNIMAIGYHSDTVSFAPDTILQSAIWNWGPYYTERMQAVIDGTWETQSLWADIGTGFVDLGPTWGPVPQNVQDQVMAVRQDLIDGNTRVFAGPITAMDGTVLVPDGEVASDEDLLTPEAPTVGGMFVEGITPATVPYDECTICG